MDNLFDSGRGRLGNLVLYKVGEKNFVRTRAERFRDRKSPAQLAQRQRVQMVSKFLGAFRDLIPITFAGEAEGHSARAAALSWNLRYAPTGAYPNIHIDRSRALLSRGPLPLPVRAWVENHVDGLLIRWENGPEAESTSARDTLLVMALADETGYGDFKFTGINRSAGECLWKPALNLSDGTQPSVWIAFRNRQETLMSDSMFVGE